MAELMLRQVNTCTATDMLTSIDSKKAGMYVRNQITPPNKAAVLAEIFTQSFKFFQNILFKTDS